MSPSEKLWKSIAKAVEAGLYAQRIHGERYCMTQVRIFDHSGEESELLCEELIATGNSLQQAEFIERVTEQFKDWK